MHRYFFLLIAILFVSGHMHAYEDEFVAQVTGLDAKYSTIVVRSKKSSEQVLYLSKKSIIYLSDGSIGDIRELLLNDNVLIFGDTEQRIIYQLNVLE